MLTATGTTVDEQSMLSELDTVRQKRQEAARGQGRSIPMSSTAG